MVLAQFSNSNVATTPWNFSPASTSLVEQVYGVGIVATFEFENSAPVQSKKATNFSFDTIIDMYQN